MYVVPVPVLSDIRIVFSVADSKKNQTGLVISLSMGES
ncbi:hypothetical protein SDC9_137530 [bioreactor metagenome]|uniref:Uncharacterized protein n=1 Tax=bioreactor metagenome TaxID=1076179 RepID=A0A645DM92_9ZZZZ